MQNKEERCYQDNSCEASESIYQFKYETLAICEIIDCEAHTEGGSRHQKGGGMNY